MNDTEIEKAFEAWRVVYLDSAAESLAKAAFKAGVHAVSDNQRRSPSVIHHAYRQREDGEHKSICGKIGAWASDGMMNCPECITAMSKEIK